MNEFTNLKALMTKKVPKKILRIERNFFVNLRKKCFWPPTPPIFLTGGVPPQIDRRATAEKITSAHSSSRSSSDFNLRLVKDTCMQRCVQLCSTKYWL